MMRKLFLYLLLIVSTSSCAQQQEKVKDEKINSQQKKIGGGCECCEGIYEGMPEKLTHEFTIADESEPGEQLEISGKIFLVDGKTPADEIILYIYHTDVKGIYPNTKNLKGCAGRHGHLRGWVKTNEKGEYKFYTIKPASYPNSTVSSHIHPVIKEPGKNEYWIDEFVFEGDPFLVGKERNNRQDRGGSGIIKLTKNFAGVLTGKRDIILGKNIPDYY